jgi:hypothetical protein
MLGPFKDNAAHVLVYNAATTERTLQAGAVIAKAECAKEEVLRGRVCAMVRPNKNVSTHKGTDGAVRAAQHVVTRAEIKETVRKMQGLSQEQREMAEDMLMKHREMFRHSLENAGQANMEPMGIKVEVDRPIRAPIYPRPPQEMATMCKSLARTLPHRPKGYPALWTTHTRGYLYL